LGLLAAGRRQAAFADFVARAAADALTRTASAGVQQLGAALSVRSSSPQASGERRRAQSGTQQRTAPPARNRLETPGKHVLGASDPAREAREPSARDRALPARMDCPTSGTGVSSAHRMLAPTFCRQALAIAVGGLLLTAQPAAGAPGAEVAGASPSPLALTWVSSDPSCEGASVAAHALESVAHGVTPRPTEAHANVGREGEHWVVELETRSESKLGRRTLRGESCEEIQRAIALLLAMIMESEAKATPPAAVLAPPPPVAPRPPEPPPSASPDPRSPERDAPPEHPAASPAPTGFGFLIRTEGTAALGVQPGLGFGAGGSIGAALGPFELLVSGAFWPASRVAIFDRDGSLEVTRKMLGVAACYQLWSVGRLRAGPCLSGELAWLEWRSLGLRATDSGEKNQLGSLTALLDLRLELFGPVFLSITPGATWERPQPFRASTCQNCTPTEVFQTWSIAPRLGAGVGARF
jgi:hypothetical protein